MKFSEFARREASGTGHVVVFVCGDELLVDESREVFQRAFGGDWNFERVTAKEFEAIEGPQLIEQALSPPLFGSSRAFMVSDGGKITKKKVAILEEIVSLPAASVKVILIAPTRRAVGRGLAKFSSIEIDPVRPGDAIRWLRQRYGVAREVAEYLVETVGSELRPLSREMEKLTAYVKDSRPVEIRDVDLLTLGSERFGPFDLDDALIARDLAKAVRVSNAMIEEGVEPLIVLSRIARVWRQLYVGKALAGEGSSADLAAAASVPHWKAAAFSAGCRRFSRVGVARGFEELVAADRRFKSAVTDRALVLDRLLWKLLRSEAA